MMSKQHTSQLLYDTLAREQKSYLRELKRCQTEFSNEAVHDLRNAMQNVKGIVQLLKAVFLHPRLHKIDQAIEAQLADLNGLRDMQVILAEISEMIQEMPELYGFQKHQLILEEKTLRSVRKKIKKIEPTDLSKRLRKEHHFLETKTKENLKPRLIQAVDDSFQVVKQRLDWVNPARTITIQRIGVAFQAFLYAVEVVHPLIGEFPEAQLEQMKHYQSLINEIQDIEIFLQTLADFSDPEKSSDIGNIRHYYECRYEEAVGAYIVEMNQLDTFWRPAPSQPFPWNRTK